MAAVQSARTELQELGYITPETLDLLDAGEIIMLLGEVE